MTAILTNTAAVVVTLNGDAIPVTFDSTTGALTATCNLIDGSNKIAIKASDCDAQTDIIYVSYTEPCNKPIINNIKTIKVPMSSLGGRDVLNYQMIALVTNVNDPNWITVKVNGIIVSSIFDNMNQTVSAQFPVIEGVNTIEVIIDGCETVTATKKFTNTTDKNNLGNTKLAKPIIKTILPTTTRKTVTSNVFYFKAKVTSIESKSQVKMTVNGRIQNTFLYSKGNSNVSGSFKLVKGMNTIVSTVTNASGSSVLKYYITYVPKVTTSKPIVTKPKPNTSKVTIPKKDTTKVTVPKTNTSKKGTTPKVSTPETEGKKTGRR